MSRARNLVLAGIGGVALLVALPVCLVGSAFVGNAELEDGRTYADGRVITVVDGYVACFLVDTTSGYALIDACQDPEAKALTAALAARGASLTDIHSVLLTHSHGDHVGGLAALGHAEVFGVPEAEALLTGQAAHEGPLPALMGAVDTGAHLSSTITDGEAFTLGDTTFVGFAVPGHTADSAAYLAHGVLFLGDNGTYKEGGELVVAPWIFTDDQDENLASMQALATKVADLEVTWLAPAHTGPAEGVAALSAM
ncbi:MAG: MBL fold metallo-hydrolase [Deltaproteobacteria bacterium]|nr:MAG: MBL fold metallo-hydrolase [Deltaproteobacteria bacterium]